MIKNAIVVLAAISMALPTYGKFSKSAARRHGQIEGNAVGSAISSASQGGNGTETTNYDSMGQASADNTNNGQKGKTTAYLMAGGLAGAAAAYFSVCSGSVFAAYAACISGGILLGMALQSRKSGQSFNGPINDSWSNVCEYSTSGCSGAVPNPYQSAMAPSEADDKINAAKRAGGNNGISVDAKTGIVRTKDGKEIDPNNPASIEAALGSEGASKLMSEVSEIEKKALDKVNKLTPQNLADAYGMIGGGAGGAMDGTGGGGYADPSDPAGAKRSLAGANARLRKPAQVSGLSKNFNGDPIGVASDSIFGMMSRRYQLKHNQKTFLGPEVQ